MLNSLWRLVGWLLLPAALVFALIVFSPFAVVLSTWALLHPGTVALLFFGLVALHYVRRGVQAAVTLYGLATSRRRARDAALRAVQSAVLR